MPTNVADMANELQLLKWQLNRATVELTAVQTENRRLRKMTANGRSGRILHRANADARQLCGWRFAGYTIARRQCLNYGMSERRWMWAAALLRLAGIVDINSRYVDDFAVDDLDACFSAIDKATRKCEVNGLGPLVFRMAKGRVQTP